MENRVDLGPQGVHQRVSRLTSKGGSRVAADKAPSSIGSCGSYLDGGACHAFQEAAIPMLDPTLVQNEMVHLQRHFRVSRRAHAMRSCPSLTASVGQA